MISMRTRKKPKKLFYICDKKKCKPCAKGCEYTTDESHALFKEHKGFEPGLDGEMYEVR